MHIAAYNAHIMVVTYLAILYDAETCNVPIAVEFPHLPLGLG